MYRWGAAELPLGVLKDQLIWLSSFYAIVVAAIAYQFAQDLKNDEVGRTGAAGADFCGGSLRIHRMVDPGERSHLTPIGSDSDCTVEPERLQVNVYSTDVVRPDEITASRKVTRICSRKVRPR